MNSRSLMIALAVFLNLFIVTGPAQAQKWGQAHVDPNPAVNLTCVAASADGKKLVACSDNGSLLPPGGQVYTSTNAGVTWVAASVTTNWWLSVASSANGRQLVTGALFNGSGPGGLYISRDAGNTWSQTLGHDTGVFSYLASSANGTNLVTAGHGLGSFGIYYSTDAGNTWNPATGDGTTNFWYGLASSADGVNMVAVGTGGPTGTSGLVYRSANSGASWSQVYQASTWLNSIASSADGTKLVAAGIAGTYTSTNSGSTWQAQAGAPAMTFGGQVASSADGTRLVAGSAQPNNNIYVSLDSGVTWAATTNSPKQGLLWVTSSTNGTRLAAIENVADVVYTLNPVLSVTGHVYCVCNSNGIAGATVVIGTNTLTTDTNGAYSLTNAAAQNYGFGAGATNYTTLITNLVVASDASSITNDVYLTNNFFVIYPMFDDSILSDADVQNITNAIWSATQVYTNYIVNPICVQALFAAINNNLGASDVSVGTISYSQYVADLQAVTNKSANDNIALASLHPPPYTGLLSNNMVLLTPALLDALGENEAATAARGGGPDGAIKINLALMNSTRPGLVASNYDLRDTVSHEVDEVLGIGGWGSVLYLQGIYNGQPLPTNGVGPLDLFRYITNGFRSFNYSNSIAPYFSLDGGATRLVSFNQYAHGSDFSDWGDGVTPADGKGNVLPKVQDAYGTDRKSVV